MKKAVVTIAVGEKYEEMAKITHPTLKAYANKIGAEFIVIDTPGNFPHWEKFKLYELLIKYNRIIYLDTDLIVRDDCPDLFEMIPETKLGVFNEGRFSSRLGSLQEAFEEYNQPFPEKYDGTYYNTGVMVLSRKHRSLFKPPSKVVSLGMFEQGYLNMKIMLDLDNDKEKEKRVEELDYKLNRMTILDSHCGIHRLDSYIVHYAGAPPQVDILRIIKMDIETWKNKRPEYEFEREIVFYAGGGMGDQLGTEPVARFAIQKMFKDVKTNFTIITNWPRFFFHLNVNCITREEYEANPKFDTPVKILKTIPAPEESTLWQTWSHISGHTLDYAAVSTLHRILPDDCREIKMPPSMEGLIEAMDVAGGIKQDMILVHPGKGWASKTFPKQWWEKVVQGLVDNGKTVGVVGQYISEDQGFVDIDLPEGVIDFRNLLSLDGLISLIATSSMLISNDSAPIHIAGAFKNKIILIATCRHPDYILPYRNGSKYFNAFAFAKKLTIDEWDLSPTKIFKEAADVVKGDIIDYIPESEEVVAKAIEMHGESKVEIKDNKEQVMDFLKKGEEKSIIPVRWNKEQYEPEVVSCFKKHLKKGDNVIDVGANHGFFTALASELVDYGIVNAFEPEHHNFTLLKNNIPESKNIRLFNSAVGDKNEEVELFFNLDNEGGHSLWDPAEHHQNPATKKYERIKEKVIMVTLDSMLDIAPNLIKTDTEGCELMVLKGAENLLKKHKPLVVAEIHWKALELMGSSQKELYEYMVSLGYKAYTLPEEEEINLAEIPLNNLVFNIVFKCTEGNL
jgi:FkbM family methyltransferase